LLPFRALPTVAIRAYLAPRPDQEPEHDTQRWRTTFQGSCPLSVLPVLWSLVLSALSTATEPCALEVSHLLDALLPSRPSELISSRSRSQGFTLQGFFPSTAADALSWSRRPIPPWPLAPSLSRPHRASGVLPLARFRPFREVIHLVDPAIPFLSFSPARHLAPNGNHPC
jgi:hypothetical protein